jgi:hypothetical protein
MEYEIKLTQQEAQIIFMGLGELPIKVGVNLLIKLQQEIAKQDQVKAMLTIQQMHLILI